MAPRLTHHAEDIWQAIELQLPGFTVEVLASIDSTNSELMRRLRQGQAEPCLLVAEEQTAGRGRLGKSWHSQAGRSLTFSLLLPLAPRDWSGLSLLVGLSLAEQLHPDVRLKWPNDLWLNQRKLGGILVETAASGGQRCAVIGVGLNLLGPDWTPQPSDGNPLAPVAPIGLDALPGPTRSDGEWLARLVPALVSNCLAFADTGFAPWVARYRTRDALLGQAVRLSDGRQGVAQGVAEDGSLRLATEGGPIQIQTGEVGVRIC